jgi:hypothetical protein
MPWQAGQSGNPGGRTRKTAEDFEVELFARKKGLDAINSLVRIATQGKSESAVVAASVALLDRGFGKPTQPIESDVHVMNYGIADRQPTAEEWADKYTATTH